MKHGKGNCHPYSVSQRLLLPFLVETMKSIAAVDENRSLLRERIEKQLKARSEVNPSRIQQKRKLLQKLSAQISSAVKRPARCSDDIAGLLSDEIRAMTRDRDALSDELELLLVTSLTNVSEEAEAAMQRLNSLSAELCAGEPHRTKEALFRMVQRVELYYGEAKAPKRTHKYDLQRGLVRLVGDQAVLQAAGNRPSGYTGLSRTQRSKCNTQPHSHES